MPLKFATAAALVWEAALPDGAAIKGRGAPARLPARFLPSGKCTSHLCFDLGLLATTFQYRAPMEVQTFRLPTSRARGRDD